MKNNSNIIATRNLLHDKRDYLAANEAISEKIIALLDIFLEKQSYRIGFKNTGTMSKIPLTIYDEKTDFLSMIIDNPINIYAFLLESIDALSFSNKHPEHSKQEILFERIREFRSNSIIDIQNLNITKIETF